MNDHLAKLIGKMRRVLALTHPEDTEHGPQVNHRLILPCTVDSDPDEEHRVPLVVIDGREISWDELGRVAAAFEGWQFKLPVAGMRCTTSQAARVRLAVTGKRRRHPPCAAARSRSGVGNLIE
jgi:hypothetical protein